MRLMLHATALALVAASVTLVAPRAVAEETHVSSMVDSRVVLGFAVPDEAAQAMMPEGWKVLTLPKGPMAGTNVVVVLFDRHLDMGPDMAAADPAASRAAVLASFGVQPGAPGARLFLTRIYTTDTDHNPYGVVEEAVISRVHGLDGPGDGVAIRSEDWTIAPVSGGEIRVTYEHAAGTPVWSEGESLTYSGANPDFYRIYRYRQIDDLAMSAALNRPLDGEISVTVTVPELAGLFDGSEMITTVISRPVYMGDVFLPDTGS